MTAGGVVHMRVLGPLEILRGDVLLPTGGPTQRAVLTVLAAHLNRVVTTERLVEGVWGDEPPDGAEHALQSHVWRLRRTLRGTRSGPDLIRSAGGGYVLELAPDRFDAARFTALVAEAEGAAAREEVDAAAAAGRAALALWRGPAYADVRRTPLVQLEVQQLEEVRLHALELTIDAELRAGKGREIVPELLELTQAHPLRERFWVQLVHALYRSERQGEALDTCRRAATLLRDELGVDPGPELRDIEKRVLRHDPGLRLGDPGGLVTGREASVRSRTQAAGTSPRARAAGEDLPGAPSPPPALVPLPAALGSGRWGGFAGRRRERAGLTSSWKGAAAGKQRMAVVSGEPGIGKTRLVAELAHDVHRWGGAVAYGRCDEELEVPYRPFIDALGHLVRFLDPVHEGEPARWEGDLRRLVPRFGVEEAPRADPEIERLRLFNAVADWLHDLAEAAPVLLVLDDLHWGDRSTLLLFRHLATARPDSRVMTIGTYRDTDVGPDHPLTGVLAELRRTGGVERVDLGGLDESEIEVLLEERAPASAAEAGELARLLHARTEGNPFFIGEVLSHLVEVGAIYQEAGGWRSDRARIGAVGVPAGVREVVRQRVAALPPQTNEVLSCAAVAGAEFDARVIASALASEVDAVIDHLEPALSRRLVLEVGDEFARHRFAHALVRQALEEEQPRSKRVRLHHRIAQALEAAGAPVTDLAHHFGEAASMADAGKAVTYSRRAAREAAERLALDESVAHLEGALRIEALLPPEPARHALLLLELGEAKNACGRVSEGRSDFLDAARHAQELGRADLLARAAVGYAGWITAYVEYGETAGLELARAALAALPPGDSIERVLCLAKLSRWLATSPDARDQLQLATEAIEMATRLGDPGARAAAIAARIWALRGQPGGPAEQLRLTDELARLAVEMRGAWELAQALAYRAIAGQILTDMATARRALADLKALAERSGLPEVRWYAAALEAAHALAEGRFDQLGDLIEREREWAPGMGEVGSLIADGRVMISALLREEWGEFDAISTAMLERYPAILAGWGFPVVIAWARGEREQGREILAFWHRDVLPLVPEEFRFLIAGFLARAAADVGATEVVETLRDILEGHRGTWCTSGNGPDWGMTDHALALLSFARGDGSEGTVELRSAIEAYRSTGARAWLAVALADLARFAGDLDEARAAASEAAAIAGDIGAPNVARRAKSAVANG